MNKIHEINTYGDDVEFAGYGGNDKDYYKTWLSARTGASSTAELLKRLENGTLSDEDWAVLGEVGITDGTTPDPNAKAKRDAAVQKTRFTNAGLNWDKYKDHFVIDENGNISVTDAFKTATGIEGNYWFNNHWAGDPDLEFLRGRILYNGNLYNENDRKNKSSELYKQLSKKDGFFEQLRKGNIRGANELIQFTPDTIAREKYDPNTIYSPFLSSINNGNV